MSKVRMLGTPFSLPKGTSQVDGNIIKKILDIRDYELQQLNVQEEILNAEKTIRNLRAREQYLKETIRQEQDELFKLYDDKILRDTVGFNR